MTLYDLRGVIDFTFDIADDEVDASFYIELDEIKERHLRNIEVIRIDRDLVVCKLTDYLRRSAYLSGLLRKYINSAYYDGETKDCLLNQLCTSKKRLNKDEDITDDGGEAVYHFIAHDMYDFLTQE